MDDIEVESPSLVMSMNDQDKKSKGNQQIGTSFWLGERVQISDIKVGMTQTSIGENCRVPQRRGPSLVQPK